MTSRRRKKAGAFAVAGVITLVLGACAGDDAGASQGTTKLANRTTGPAVAPLNPAVVRIDAQHVGHVIRMVRRSAGTRKPSAEPMEPGSGTDGTRQTGSDQRT